MSWPPGRFFSSFSAFRFSLPKSPQLFVRSRVSDLHLYPSHRLPSPAIFPKMCESHIFAHPFQGRLPRNFLVLPHPHPSVIGSRIEWSITVTFQTLRTPSSPSLPKTNPKPKYNCQYAYTALCTLNLHSRGTPAFKRCIRTSVSQGVYHLPEFLFYDLITTKHIRRRRRRGRGDPKE